MNQIPAGWTTVTFGQIIERMSNGMSGAQNKEGCGIPVSRIETIAGQKIDFSRIGYIAEYDKEVIERYRINPGEILFSHINSPSHIGKTALYEGERTLYHGINLLRIQVNQKFCIPKFFQYACKLLRANGQFSLNAQHAVNQSSLNQSKIAAFEVKLPPLAEQYRIVGKLDTIQARVDAVNARLARVAPILKRFRKSVLAAATSGRLTEDWRSSHNLPEHQITSLGELIKVSSGDGLTAKEMHSDGGIPVYGGNGVNGVNGYHNEANVSEPTIVIGRVGYYCGSVHLTPSAAWITDNALRVKFSSAILNREFLHYALMGTNLRENMSSTAQPVISGQKIYPLEFRLPILEEQVEIVRRVETLFTFADRLEARLKAAQTATERLTPSLLAKAFRGALVPQDE